MLENAFASSPLLLVPHPHLICSLDMDCGYTTNCFINTVLQKKAHFSLTTSFMLDIVLFYTVHVIYLYIKIYGITNDYVAFNKQLLCSFAVMNIL